MESLKSGDDPNGAQSYVEVMGVLRELAIVASDTLPTSTTLHTILDIIGRYSGWLFGRVVARPGQQIDGETAVIWHNPLSPHQNLPGFDWDGELVNYVLESNRPLVVSDIHAESVLAHYFAGVRSEFNGYIAYPVQIQNDLAAVVEFYSGKTLQISPANESVLAHGATLLGLVIERGRAEARLRDSERRFRAIFDHSYQLIGLLEADGTLIETNATALEFGGLAIDQVAGQKYWETYWWQTSPETRANLKAAIERAAAGEFVQYETEVQGAGGQLLIIDLSIKPIRNLKDEVVQLISEGRNITELRRTLQHLRLTERRLEEAQRIANIGHWDYDIASEKANWSNTLYEIFGLDPNETVTTSQTFLDAIHPDDIQDLEKSLERSFQNGQPYEHYFRILRPDGMVRTVFGAGRPIVGDTGVVARMTGIVQDVTGRRQLEESLALSVERLSGLNRMGQAVSSSLDLGSIYSHVLSAGRVLLEADAMVLFLHEGNELIISAVDQVGDFSLLGRRIPDDAGVAGESWQTGNAVWLSGDECRNRRSDQLARSAGFNPGTIIAVPVRWQDQVIGVLEAVDVDEDAFTLDDVRMLQAVANWTAIAIGNVRQHQSLERRLQESEAIATVSQALSETLEPQSILELIINSAHGIVPRSDWGVIHLLSGRPERLIPAAVAGTDVDLSDYIIGPNEGVAGLALTQGQLINVQDTQTDPRPSSYAQSIGLRSLLVAPVQSRSRRLGTITLHCMQPGAFTEDDERLLTILASQAGLAFENAQLFDSQRRARLVAELRRERLRILADRIVTAQEEERLRISRELHDEAGQALTSLKISLDLLKNGLAPEHEMLRTRLSDLATLTGETMENLRALAHDLRPPGLDAFGLNVAMEGLCYDFATRTALPVRYQGIELTELPTAVALSMYRFAQEALTNIAKHAEAHEVSVHLYRDESALYLSIADDGKGFALDSEVGRGGLGLVSMQERTDLLGGELEIETEPGQGTRMTARVPVGFS